MSPITAALNYRLGKGDHKKDTSLTDFVIRDSSNSSRLAKGLSAVADQPPAAVCYSKSHPDKVSRTRAQE